MCLRCVQQFQLTWRGLQNKDSLNYSFRYFDPENKGKVKTSDFMAGLRGMSLFVFSLLLSSRIPISGSCLPVHVYNVYHSVTPFAPRCPTPKKIGAAHKRSTTISHDLGFVFLLAQPRHAATACHALHPQYARAHTTPAPHAVVWQL